MAIRVTLECGHASTLRVRKTAEGYTHDWEVFVRGVDNADIHHYIDRVIFHLHQTFPKPKRILKEPPFAVKESGYAGFLMPIEVYLKNKDEPKKFDIFYDLILQNSGPTVNNVIRHNETITNPSDEFRRKLLKGGAMVVSNLEGSIEKNDSKTPTMIGKPKLSGGETKKHKFIESKTSDSFAELFGTPLKPTKVLQEKKSSSSQPEKSSMSKPLVTPQKSEKVKHGPHKDKEKKDKVEEKKEKKIRDSSKDKERSKEKSKRPSSPSGKSHSSPSAKRPLSPVAGRTAASPSLPPAKRLSSPKLVKEKELKKVVQEKEKEKEKEKSRGEQSSKSMLDSSKSEKRKDKKKHKEDREKERKDKYRESDRSSVKETAKPASEKKNEKVNKIEKPEKERNQEYKSSKEERKSPKPTKELEKPKEEKLVKIEKIEKPEKSEKPKDGKTDKDRQKHKHKKREKKEKRDGSREREKKEKRDRVKVSAEKQNNVPIVPMVQTPLSTLLAEMRERESSDSAPSVDDDSFSEPKLVPSIKKEAERSPLPVPNHLAETAKPLSLGITTDIKKEKPDRSRRDKTKSSSRAEEKENRKRKRRSASKGDEERVVKREKERGHSTSPPLEPVSSSQSPVAVDQEPIHPIKEKEDRNTNEQVVEKDSEADPEQVAPDSTNSTLADSDVGEAPVFSEDYVSQLKDLQQKIMTLQDNQELQRVVQVIAETGQYEITKKTFDFDLCALDRRTVARLQQFFSAS